MRNKEQKWLLGALACALALPFTGCSNDDEPIPGGGGNGEEVKTQLALVVTGQIGTRAASDEMDDTFDGMTNIHLLSYSDNDQNHYVTSNSTLVGNTRLEDFDNFTTETTSKIKVYDNVSLPNQAVNFMFYGKTAYTYGNAGRDQALQENFPTSSSGQASTTTFTLNSLTASESTTDMTSYIDDVMEAAVSAINAVADNTALKTKFQTYVEGVSSPALYQVAYLMAQLYFDTDFAGIADNGWDAVKTAIASDADNFVFKSTTSASLSNISDLMNLINTDNEKYLGENFPVGGKTLSISIIESAGTWSGAEVAIEAGENDDKYKYPTPLYFMANTYPVEYNNEEDWANLGSTFVDLKNRPAKIALKDQINFAVGKLTLKFTVASGIQGSDATGDFGGTFNQENLEVVGILLNNQNQVGWNFLPGSNTDGIAYDNIFAAAGGSGAQELGMLALATKQNEVVKFALEVKNKSDKNFKGVNGGIVPAGATFYVCGELDPAKGTGSVNAENAPAAFSPDYNTTVNVTLNSLENAQNTVPDLNAANLQLALSVDLSWEEGYSFDIDIE